MPIERVKNLNPQRLNWCFEQFGVSVDELAATLKISSDTLNGALLGEVKLTVKQLKDIANFFCQGVLFFLDSSPPEISEIYSPEFRTTTNSRPHIDAKLRALLKRTEQLRRVFLELQEDESRENEPLPPWQPSFAQKREFSLRQKAKATRSWLELEDYLKFEDLRTSIEMKGILVFVSNGYLGKWQIEANSGIRGFSLNFDVCPVVAIRKQESEAAQAFTLLHELGHLIIDGGNHVDGEEDIEYEPGNEKDINEFAGLVLVPDEILDELDIDNLPDEVAEIDGYFNWICRERCVSTEVILRRLLNTRRITRDLYRDYRSYKTTFQETRQNATGGNRIRFKEPLKMFGRPYVQVVLESLVKKEITATKASGFLDNLNPNDLHELLNHVSL